MTDTKLTEFLARCPYRKFHPESWAQIHETREALLAELRALATAGISVDSPLRMFPAFWYHFGYDGLNDIEIQRAVSAFFHAVCPQLDYTASHCVGSDHRARPGGRIRLGVCSTNLWSQTVGQYMISLYWGLPKTRFEIVSIKPGKSTDDAEARLLDTLADRVVTTPPALGPARQAIANLGCDAILFPDIGMNLPTYLLAQARLAPVQCVTFGHPITTASPNMDYFLSSHLIEPEDGAQDAYTERLVRMRALPWQVALPPRFSRTASREEFGLPVSGRLYFCFQNLYKIHPEFDGILDAILTRDPEGHIIFSSADRQKPDELQARLARTLGERIKRVHFLKAVPNAEFVNFAALADVHLDPIHFGAGRTAYEALAAGVPVVTWPGHYMRGRLMHGMYRQMDLLDCVARDYDDYVDKAVALANDRDWREEVSAKIRARRDVIYETETPAREVAAFLEAAVDAAYQGQGPISWDEARTMEVRSC